MPKFGYKLRAAESLNHLIKTDKAHDISPIPSAVKGMESFLDQCLGHGETHADAALVVNIVVQPALREIFLAREELKMAFKAKFETGLRENHLSVELAILMVAITGGCAEMESILQSTKVNGPLPTYISLSPQSEA